MYFPDINEQNRIVDLLFKIDGHIETQDKIIGIITSQINWIKKILFR